MATVALQVTIVLILYSLLSLKFLEKLIKSCILKFFNNAGRTISLSIWFQKQSVLHALLDKASMNYDAKQINFQLCII